MKSFRDKRALITGAGRGIGRETALAFARAGAEVLVVDLLPEPAEAVAAEIRRHGGRASAFAADVADEQAMAALAEAVHARYPALDILVNNAGIASVGYFLETRLATWRKVLDVNVMGVVHGCHFFLPKMVARGTGGHVVNLSSMLGYFADSKTPAYAASKHAVLGFSEALRAELQATGIGVSAICPGIVNTPLLSQGTMFEGVYDQGQNRARVAGFYQRRAYSPAKVAEAILDAVRHNRAVVPVSPEAWAAYYLKRLAPAALAGLVRHDVFMGPQS